MSNLYSLNTELTAINEQLEVYAMEHEGLIDDFPYAKHLDTLREDIGERALSIGVWIKNLISDEKAIKEEVKALTARAKAKANKAAGLKNYLSSILEAGTKYEDSKCKISWRKSESISIDIDAEKLPELFQKVAITADKTELKKAIKAGIDIEGTSLVSKQSIQVK